MRYGCLEMKLSIGGNPGYSLEWTLAKLSAYKHNTNIFQPWIKLCFYICHLHNVFCYQFTRNNVGYRSPLLMSIDLLNCSIKACKWHQTIFPSFHGKTYAIGGTPEWQIIILAHNCDPHFFPGATFGLDGPITFHLTSIN